MSDTIHDVIVVGAGPGGLSAAHELVQAGFQPLVLEQTPAVGDVWRNHYDGLKLNTGRILSRLPGNPIPKSAGGWPTRDDLAKVLESMPARGGFKVNTGIEVSRISYDPASDSWTVRSKNGPTFISRSIVVATGGSRIPVLPEWPGQDSFNGQIIHSSKFRSAKDYAGRRVLVVGCGNSSAEIASRLTEFASQVICSVRTPPHLLPKSLLGIPMAGWGLLLRHFPDRVSDKLLHWLGQLAIGDLSRHGLPSPATRLSVKFRESNVLPTLYEPFSKDVRAGKIRIVGTIRKIAPDAVFVDEHVDRDGTVAKRQVRLEIDTIVAGTGFRTGLDELIEVQGITLADGRPAVTGEQEFKSAPRLFFIGQSNPLTGQLREIRLEAEKIAASLSAVKKPVHSRCEGELANHHF